MKEYTLFKSLRSQLGLISNSKLFLLVEFCPAPYVSLTNFFFVGESFMSILYKQLHKKERAIYNKGVSNTTK